MLQKGKVNINLFSKLTRSKKDTALSSDIDKNSKKDNGNKKNNNNNEVNSSINDIKVPFPSLKDMEFSCYDNF